MATPTLDELLRTIGEALRIKDGSCLRDLLPTEAIDALYDRVLAEIYNNYPSESDDQKLEEHCAAVLPNNPDWMPDDNEGQAWPGFIVFLRGYFVYIRDRDMEDWVECHEHLWKLTEQCITALSHSSMGIVILPFCLRLAWSLKQLSLRLERTEEVRNYVFQRRRRLVQERIRFYSILQPPAERAAELLQRALVACMTDRSGGGGPGARFQKPEGKRVAVYEFANLIAKLMFGCRKIDHCTQLFANIQQQAPPLSYYPASQRVTFLYHLGRYNSSLNNHYRAILCLESAYMQCPANAYKQRRQILIHLMADSIVMGRFPSQTLLMRPEAQDMGQIFIPICKAMKAGDFRALRSLTGGNERYPAPDQDIATSREWAMKFSLSYKLWFLCDVITWRSLARRTFLIAGFAGEGKKAPTMNLEDLVVTAGTQDPYLVWPNGEPPWYNNIDRLQWITDQRAEWDKEIAQWTPNPEDDVKQYWWEPDKDGPRMMKGFAFGQPSSGDYQNPLNKAALSRFRRYKQSRELLKRDLIKEQIEVFGDEDTKDGNTEESGFAGATFNNEFLRPPQAAVQAASSDSGGSTFDEDMEVDDVPLFIPEQYADHTPPGYDSDTDSLASNTYTGPFLPLPLPPAHPIPTRTYPPPRPLTPPPPLDPSMPILSVVASLISSKLIHAFVSWKQRKLGILGAKAAGGSAVKAGFPTPWATLVKKMEERDRQMDFKEGYVPGWVRIEFEKGANIGRSGGVVRLSNVRGVGE